MQKLLLITDLWGLKKSNYVNSYMNELEKHYDVQLIDACRIGKIDQRVYTEAALHRQFVEGGIDNAVQYLLDSINEPIHILGFSVGGLIGWKFALQSSNVQRLICVSSTRLRKETEKPLTKIDLYFGEADLYNPDTTWFSKMGLDPVFFSGQGHNCYKSTDSTNAILDCLFTSKVD